ncbi:MAG TPA: hypothetical protein PKD43_17710 [Nitrospira sp.]|nr:hypothetical protein [Nitrospira sp.]HNG04361.1 hypothetical protein [Nitrospira sp.]HNG55507.1 hypothetical protein [Nitrospira sp.]
MQAQTIVYIGRRPYHKDCTYGTGEWVNGQSKVVDAAIAFKMLRHPDVYQDGGVVADGDVSDPVTTQKKATPEHETEETLWALDAINTMDTDALCSFVAQNFNQKLDRRKSLNNLRLDAENMVHQFGVAS